MIYMLLKHGCYNQPKLIWIARTTQFVVRIESSELDYRVQRGFDG